MTIHVDDIELFMLTILTIFMQIISLEKGLICLQMTISAICMQITSWDTRVKQKAMYGSLVLTTVLPK